MTFNPEKPSQHFVSDDMRLAYDLIDFLIIAAGLKFKRNNMNYDDIGEFTHDVVSYLVRCWNEGYIEHHISLLLESYFKETEFVDGTVRVQTYEELWDWFVFRKKLFCDDKAQTEWHKDIARKNDEELREMGVID